MAVAFDVLVIAIYFLGAHAAFKPFGPFIKHSANNLHLSFIEPLFELIKELCLLENKV